MHKTFAMFALAVVATLSSPAVPSVSPIPTVQPVPASHSELAPADPLGGAVFVVDQACLRECLAIYRSCSLNCSVAPDPAACDAGCSASDSACRASCL